MSSLEKRKPPHGPQGIAEVEIENEKRCLQDARGNGEAMDGRGRRAELDANELRRNWVVAFASLFANQLRRVFGSVGLVREGFGNELATCADPAEAYRDGVTG